MKKILIASITFMFVLSVAAVPALAKVDRVPGPTEYGPWMINESSAIAFSCGGGTYNHTLNTVDQTNGDFTGTGTYDPNNGYTWEAEGSVDGDDFEMTITYTGLDFGAVYNLVGTIDEDGSISGSADSNCQSFVMPAGSASREDTTFTGNHGQWVKSQENKKEAAQSRIGMPVQSKGHTK